MNKTLENENINRTIRLDGGRGEEEEEAKEAEKKNSIQE